MEAGAGTAPPPGKIFDAATQTLIDDPDYVPTAEELAARAAGEGRKEPEPEPPAEAEPEPNFVILAGPKPEDGHPPKFVEVGKVYGRSGDEAKRNARKLPSIATAVKEHGGIALAVAPIRSWAPELVEPPDETIAPPMKVTPLS